MKYIRGAALLAALCVTLLAPFGAGARSTSCPAPCFGGYMDNTPKWPQPGGKTTVVFAVTGSGVKTLTLSMKKLNPVFKLVKTGSSHYSIVKGVPTWILTNVGSKSMHFKLQVSPMAKRGKMYSVTLHYEGVAGDWSKKGDQPLGIYVATKPNV